MEVELSNRSQLNLSERSMMVTKLWQEIMLHFEDMGLEQTVGLLLFRGSNYIEYVDCDIEGDTGTILRAKNVVSTIPTIFQNEIITRRPSCVHGPVHLFRSIEPLLD